MVFRCLDLWSRIRVSRKRIRHRPTARFEGSSKKVILGVTYSEPRPMPVAFQSPQRPMRGTGLFFRQVVSGLVIPFPETNTVSGRDSVRLEPSILLVEPGFI